MQGEYAVGQVIEVTYQASASQTGLTDVIMEIYDEARAKDLVNFPDVTMTEIGVTGRYYGTFTPDAVGKWRAMINSVTKPGKIIKDFGVVAHNIDSIGADVDGVKTKTDNLPSDPASATNVSATETAIRGADSDTLKTISDQIDAIPTASPAMIG
jgi:hypothetical protein